MNCLHSQAQLTGLRVCSLKQELTVSEHCGPGRPGPEVGEDVAVGGKPEGAGSMTVPPGDMQTHCSMLKVYPGGQVCIWPQGAKDPGP